MSNDIKFRTIFVSEPSHDMSGLKEFTDDIRFITTGYENIEALSESIEKVLEDFDPTKDAIVPTGKVVTSMIIGAMLNRMVHYRKYPTLVNFGIFKDKKYLFMELELS